MLAGPNIPEGPNTLRPDWRSPSRPPMRDRPPPPPPNRSPTRGRPIWGTFPVGLDGTMLVIPPRRTLSVCKIAHNCPGDEWRIFIPALCQFSVFFRPNLHPRRSRLACESSCSVHSDATEAEFWGVRQGQARSYKKRKNDVRTVYYSPLTRSRPPLTALGSVTHGALPGHADSGSRCTWT